MCAFLWLAVLVETGRTASFDATIRDAVHACARPAITFALRAATFIGSGEVLWPLGVVVAIWLVWTGRRREAARFALTVLGADLADEVLKLVFHRHRPEAWFGFPLPESYSFPSGHSFLSSVFYFMLATLVMRPEWTAWTRGAAYAATLLFVLSVGFSRIYLGVHYPSDVLGGFMAGAAWLAGERVTRERRVPGAVHSPQDGERW
jgi:undecaprenyl-diphosphatase